MFNPYKPSVLNSAGPDQTQQNAASDQGLHSLLTEGFIKIWIKIEDTTQRPYKRKCTGPIDKRKKSIRLKWVT